VAELADAPDSGSGDRKVVEVQLLSAALPVSLLPSLLPLSFPSLLTALTPNHCSRVGSKVEPP